MKKREFLFVIITMFLLVFLFFNKNTFFTGKAATSDTTSETSTCTSNWQCSSWSSCVNGYQTRTCNDLNNCAEGSQVTASATFDPNSQPQRSRACNCNPPSCNQNDQTQYCFDYQWNLCSPGYICSNGNCVLIPKYSLTIIKSGTGAGNVVSNIAGINCGNDCTETYNSGTSITLTASPLSGSTFSGWTGVCTGTGICVININSNTNANANFNIVPSCTNDCTTSGAKQCSGNGYQTCGNYDDDSCFEFGDVISCNPGQTCSGGACSTTCTNECTTSGAKQCSGNGYQTCGNYDDDSCFEFGDVISCNSGQTCSGGACSTTCTNDCTTSGAKQCSGNGYQTCDNYDADSCLEWSTITNCNSGQTCNNGNCQINQQITQTTNENSKINKKFSICTNIIDCPIGEECVNGKCVLAKDKNLINSKKCLDGTLIGKCSKNLRYCDESGKLITDILKCPCPINSELSTDKSSCVLLNKGLESSDLNLINNPPVFSFIPEIEISIEEIEEKELINLKNYAFDPEKKELSFSFEDNKNEFNSDLINCYIKKDIFKCDKPKKSGNIDINIYASDGLKESYSQIHLKIIPKSVETAKGVFGAKGESNKAPIANAGDDKTVVSGSIVILDGSKSYDEENNLLSSGDNYIWYESGKEIGKGINLKKTFSNGVHKVVLQVIDSEGLSSTDSVLITVKSRDRCRDTNTIYFPPDTNCNKKWPSQEGELLNLNSPGYSCSLVEVCNEDLDYIVDEAINCCDGTPLTKDQSRINACSFANKKSNQNTKKCQALYLMQALGGDSIYMKDYLEVEMCCRGVEQLCNSEQNLYSAKPLPKAGKDLSELKCKNDPNNNPPGEWVSDSRLDLNNIALQDVPAHVSLNILSSGTCVDYSFSLTTLLRKLGYKQDEIYTVEASNHAYNLIKLPLDKKYTLVDTTGNNNPAIVFGKVPPGYNYCEGIQKCYNDNGQALCPTLEEVYGCEGIKKSIAQETKVVGFKANKFIDTIINLIKGELER